MLSKAFLFDMLRLRSFSGNFERLPNSLVHLIVNLSLPPPSPPFSLPNTHLYPSIKLLLLICNLVNKTKLVASPVAQLSRAMSTSTSVTESSSTHIHRVKVLNLPTHENSAIKKFLSSHGVERFKKAPKWRYAFINFEV